MAEAWEVYVSRVNDELASICVDSALQSIAPCANLPVVGWVFVEMNSPREDGLPSSTEAPALRKIEDKLVDSLSLSGSKLAGIIGSAGVREFYFYVSSADWFADAVSVSMRDFSSYRYDAGAQPDPEWRQYFDVLCPTRIDKRMIENRKVLTALRGHGDSPSEPRDVDHFAYFSNQTERSHFCDWATSQGFEAEASDADDLTSSKPWGAAFTRCHPVDEETIDGITIELEDKAIEFGGYYDGWGCPVTKSKTTSGPPSWLSKILKNKR